jgi:hypothetical protein
MLRHLGCRLPIELWQREGSEIDVHMRRIFKDLEAHSVDASVRLPAGESLGGWQLKAFAPLNCRFREVLMLDADNVPVRSPEFLFDSGAYRATGSIFWPDYGRLGPGRSIWRICQVPYRDEAEFESGQIVVDKRRSWRALQLAMHLNSHSDFYYRHVHGDKETFHMAWRMLDEPYTMVPWPIHSLPATMCQHDLSGRRLFQHRNFAK